MNILIVDDNEDALYLIGLIFRDHFVLSFTNLEVLQNVDFSNIDVVVTDYKLIRHTGFDVLEYVKKQREDIPVYMITGYKDPELKISALKAGFAECFSKDSLALLKNRIENEN